jgi:Rps23 Pro-64 3,4-dihydroxylase Tpa1-like proline 4-hydroxylase
MIRSLLTTATDYQAATPFPHTVIDNWLNTERAMALQQDILDISSDQWDRYDNPFEQKFTLRDKYHLPPRLKALFEELESDAFVQHLSTLCGHPLLLDTTRNFWGVHMYGPGDKLDIHVDAGLHPTMNLKKQVTLGLYLSLNWHEEYGCNLELWNGSNAGLADATLYEKVVDIAPLFNRLVLFTCNDVSWHGNPVPATCPPSAKRIFVTISYMSRATEDLNQRKKALFIARPGDPEDPEKARLRLLRADPERYKEVYRINNSDKSP